MIVLDTSLLIDALCGPRRSALQLRRALESGELILLPSLVLYEWLRGPRLEAELEAQEALFPRAAATRFGSEEAALAADLYGRVPRARGREIDLAISAGAILRDAGLWTLNLEDFQDIPELSLYSPPEAL